MSGNLKSLWLKAWAAGERGQWLYGLLGRLSDDGTTVTVTVPHRPDFVYVRMGPAGDQGIAEVRKKGSVALRPGLAVRMRVDSGVLTLYETDVALMGADANAPDDGSGVAYHTHPAATFLGLTDTPAAYTGAAGKVATVNAGATGLEFVLAGDTTAAINAAALKTPPVDADWFAGINSAAANVIMRVTWANVKATLKTYFDTLYNLYVHPNHSGDVTSVADGATTIAAGAVTTVKILDDAVTYAKLQNVSATDRVLGRATAGAGNVEEIAMTAAGRALVDDADAAAQRATLGLVIGTNVQAQDAELAALAGLTSAADSAPYFTGLGTAALATLTAFGRSLMAAADATAGRTALALGTMAVEAGNAFLRLAGVAGGQTAYGGTAANEDLTLEGTVHATKTTSYVLLQPGGGNVSVGNSAPGVLLDVGDTLGASFAGKRISIGNASGPAAINIGTDANNRVFLYWDDVTKLFSFGVRVASVNTTGFIVDGGHVYFPDGNVGVGTQTQFGSGTKVIGIANASVVPTTNPTGGGVLYVQAGALKYRGSSGTITTLAVA